MEALLVVLSLGFYLLPSIVAAAREHRNGVPIFILNLLLGWTGVVWVGCLAWAAMDTKGR